MNSTIRNALTALAVAASLTVAACGGSGVDNDEAERLRDHATQVQEDAQRTAEEVRAGTKDAEQAAEEIQDDVTGLANESINAVEDAESRTRPSGSSRRPRSSSTRRTRTSGSRLGGARLRGAPARAPRGQRVTGRVSDAGRGPVSR